MSLTRDGCSKSSGGLCASTERMWRRTGSCCSVQHLAASWVNCIPHPFLQFRISLVEQRRSVKLYGPTKNLAPQGSRQGQGSSRIVLAGHAPDSQGQAIHRGPGCAGPAAAKAAFPGNPGPALQPPALCTPEHGGQTTQHRSAAVNELRTAGFGVWV